MITLAPKFSFDASEGSTQKYAVLGATGSGKSYLAGLLVEELFMAGCPVIVFDWVGNWWGLRYGKDGVAAGLPIAVFGGLHGDVPLDKTDGDALGALLIEKNQSAVIDLSLFSKTARRQFVAACCEAMFSAGQIYRQPRMVVWEECQEYAPQRMARGEERMLGAVTNIVRVGRALGFGSIMVTQRPQSVSKEILNQAELLLVGRLGGPQERKVVAEWMREKSSEARAKDLEHLPALAPGEFFAWSPSWLKRFERIWVKEKHTFDTSSTPKLGTRLEAPKVSSPGAAVGSLIEAWRACIGAVVEEKRELEEKTASSRQPARGASEVKKRDLEAVKEEAKASALLRGSEKERDRLAGKVIALEGLIVKLEGVIAAHEERNAVLSEFLQALRKETSAHAASVEKACKGLEDERSPRVKSVGPLAAKAVVRYQSERAARVASEEVVGLTPYELDILRAAAPHAEVTRKQLALLAGKSLKSSQFGVGVATLTAAGLLVKRGGVFLKTDKGFELAGRPTLPHGRKLWEYWAGKLSEYDRRILVAAVEHPGPLGRGELSRLSACSLKSSQFAVSLSQLVELGLLGKLGQQFFVEPFILKAHAAV